MKCPVDNETLVMTDRSGVEIDYCPKCRGVWLDRGELDKIVERAGAGAAPAVAAHAAPPPRRDQDYDRGYQQGYGKKPYKKKREGFLGELFDF